MNIKDTIKALLKSNFGGVQLSDTRVEALAKNMEGKVTTEEELLAKLEAFNELKPLSEIASEDDRARTAQAELDKLKGKKPVVEERKPEEEETPAWAKALVEGQKAMADTIAALQSEKVVNDRKASLLAKLTNADEAYSGKVLRDFGRMSFATDEDFAAYLTDVESDFAAHVQATAESKLGKDTPYTGASGGNLKDDEVSPAMQAIIEQRKAEAAAKANA